VGVSQTLRRWRDIYRWLYLAGRPSRLASTHILVCCVLPTVIPPSSVITSNNKAIRQLKCLAGWRHTACSHLATPLHHSIPPSCCAITAWHDAQLYCVNGRLFVDIPSCEGYSQYHHGIGPSTGQYQYHLIPSVLPDNRYRYHSISYSVLSMSIMSKPTEFTFPNHQADLFQSKQMSVKMCVNSLTAISLNVHTLVQISSTWSCKQESKFASLIRGMTKLKTDECRPAADVQKWLNNVSNILKSWLLSILLSNDRSVSR